MRSFALPLAPSPGASPSVLPLPAPAPSEVVPPEEPPSESRSLQDDYELGGYAGI
jgi:hypothetical protein